MKVIAKKDFCIAGTDSPAFYQNIRFFDFIEGKTYDVEDLRYSLYYNGYYFRYCNHFMFSDFFKEL